MRPGHVWLYLGASWAILALAAIFWSPAKVIFLASGLLLLVLGVWDGWAMGRYPPLRAEREVADSLALGIWTEVTLLVAPREPRRMLIDVFDGVPPAFDTRFLPATLPLRAGQGAKLVYQVRALRRGDHRFGEVEVLVHSPWRLWRRRQRVGEAKSVRVLPNFQPVARYALLALEDRLGDMGIRLQRQRGHGMEFRELREYREGDSLRQIDWKATARCQKVISRQYEEERNQQIVLVLDCGRRLRAKDGDLTHFDHVLNAALLLGWVALRQGDAVGLATVGGVDRFLGPQKGVGGLPALVRTVYDLEPTLEPADYEDVASRILAKQRRRALVVVLTNVRDEDVEDLVPAVALLRQRHLVLVASLREAALREAADQPIRRFDDALEVAMTHQYLEARRAAHEKLEGHGALVLDVEPTQLAVAVVNRYLEIKRAGRL